MRGGGRIRALWGAELRRAFLAPVAYALAAFFLFVNGYFFGVALATRVVSLEDWFWRVAAVLLFVLPALSMRLLSEEYRTGTYAWLAAEPVRPAEIATAKWLGVCVLLLFLLLPLGGFALVLHLLARRVGGLDPGPVASGFLGLLALGAGGLGVGLAASAATRSQAVAALGTFVLLVSLYLSDAAAPTLGARSPWLRETLLYLSARSHLYRFFRGEVALADLGYFAELALVGWAAAVLCLEARRWRSPS